MASVLKSLKFFIWPKKTIRLVMRLGKKRWVFWLKKLTGNTGGFLTEEKQPVKILLVS